MKRVSILLCSIICLLFSMSIATAATVKIGLMCPLTGDFAPEGQDMKKVVELLAEEVNKNGGIKGDTVEIVVEDDGSSPRTAALAAQRLATAGVTSVIGTYGSAVTLASQGIYNEAGIVQIATGSTAVRLTAQGHKMFFRTSPRDDDQGRFLVKTIKAAGAKKIALLHDNSAYAKGLAGEVQSILKKEGGVELVFFDALKAGEQDYTTVLTKIKGTNPDLLVFTGYYTEAGLLLRQSRENKWIVPILGGDATNNAELVKVAGPAVSGYRFVSPPMPGDLNSPEAKNFLAAYKAKYNGTTPSSIWSVAAGDAFLVLAEAIKTKGSKAKDMAAYLHDGVKEFPVLTGNISFDAKGDRVGDTYRLYQVAADGTFVMQ